jgi:hypothetical protein
VFNWAAPGTVYDVELVSKRTAAGSTEPQNRIEVFRLDKRLNLHESMIPVLQGYATGAILIPSPSGRRVLVVPSRTMRHISPWIRERSGLSQVRLIPESGGWEVDYLHGWHTVDVVDISASRVLATRQLRAATLWWQSEDEIGYLDRDGRRHIVQLR